MFGRRASTKKPRSQLQNEAGGGQNSAPQSSEGGEEKNISPYLESASKAPAEEKPKEIKLSDAKQNEYNLMRNVIYKALIDAIDIQSLSEADVNIARKEIRSLIQEIVQIKNIILSKDNFEKIVTDIIYDILGFGPLEPLLQRDDIADIMINGADKCYIETGGRIQLTPIKFADNQQLMNICQRIVSQVGRRVDEFNPICDARLLDGSRVNVIAPPLAIDGPTLTIRKFKKDKLRKISSALVQLAQKVGNYSILSDIHAVT